MNYLAVEQILDIYNEVMEQTGGTKAVRDMGLLESAAARPHATFAQQDLYPDVFSKAAALGHSMISNHPFVDGNKRAGYMAMRIFLNLNGYEIKASLNKRYEFVMEIAQKKRNEESISEWLKKYSKEGNDKRR